jgi:hypothetical protein
MSTNSIVNAITNIFDGFFAYAQSVHQERGLDDDEIESLRKLWEENKEKIEEEIKMFLPTKKTRTKKPKNAPKNAKSAYILYCQDERANVKAENPNLNAKEVLKILGGKWKETDEETKAKYQKMAEEDKTRYAEEMKTYVPSDEEDEKKPRKARAKKAKNAPKNAKSAYIFYCQNERPNLKTENPNLDAKEVLKILGGKWKETDEETKAKYQKMAEEDKIRYAEEMKTYVPSDEEKKSRKERVKKDKNAPKNVRSAYMFYCEKNRDVIKKKNPELKGKEITAKLSEEWKKIKDTDKAKKYIKMVEEDKKRHANEMEEYNQKKHLIVSDEDDEDEEDEDLEEEKPESLVGIIANIIENFEGDTITKGVIKKLLNEKKIEFTKEEFETALKKAQA